MAPNIHSLIVKSKNWLEAGSIALVEPIAEFQYEGRGFEFVSQ